jgi:membrane-associated phospholipid phosphatase
MPIFPWEQSLIDKAETWPKSGATYEMMAFISDFSRVKWVILAVLIILLLIYGWRRLAAPILLCGLSAGIGDLISRRVVKALVMRPRPHYLHQECLASSCWGFVSSHCTNVAAIVAFLVGYDRRNAIWGFPLVMLVCESRIYLGDHYPLDTACGVGLGAGIGTFVYLAYEHYVETHQKPKLALVETGDKH